MAKILVLDDLTLFRAGLIGILKREPRFCVVGQYGSFEPVKSIIAKFDAHIILMDISIGNESGLEIVKYIKSVNPSLKVVILSTHKEEFYVVNALEAGVDGYIHKDADPEELITGLSKIENGEKFYSMEISNLLINNIYHKPNRGLPFLTNKEKEIITHLMDGLSSKEIADILDISPRTVETHRANVLGKFHLKNTTELVKKIVEHKIKF